MVATLQSSVGKMNDLLARLAQHNTGRSDVLALVDLRALLTEVVDTKRRQHDALVLTVEAGRHIVEADPDRLEQLFAHLLQNAIDASPGGQLISVQLRSAGGSARIDIVDNGVGMSPAFVRAELFKPVPLDQGGRLRHRRL